MFMPAMSTAAKQMAEAASQGQTAAELTGTQPAGAGVATPEDALASASVSSTTNQQVAQSPPLQQVEPELKDIPPQAPRQVATAARRGTAPPPGVKQSNLPLILGIAVPAGLVLVVILLWLFVFSK